jgi:chromosome segregation protein
MAIDLFSISIIFEGEINVDKGAHFYRTDFQVHTPRDINWIGAPATSTDERKEYAELLVVACRKKGINAIAITDHHDFVFFPYIKQAALSELNDDGKVYPTREQLIVFPGLELTLASPPCQALLILDSSFPENLLSGVLSALGITPNDEAMTHTCSTVAIPHTVSNNFIELYKLLNNLGYVKGRFTIFPHIGDGGHKTLLRSGFYDYYKSMPCVGGYIESPISNMGEGNICIINGKNRDYGFKSIAMIQTSDNRKETHEDLGKYTTWIKWAEPTAEALRQACLANVSRISQETPVLPPTYITSLDVSNSKFLGRVCIEFNNQYNAIIGGRGTGKSTILEYLRWCLCDQQPDITLDDTEIPNYQERRKKLIDNTLLPFDATVQVSFIKNGITHTVRRKARTGEIFLKIGNTEFTLCTEVSIRNILPIQAYSQKQLSNVSTSNSELKRLVYSPIRQALTEIDIPLKSYQADIRACFEKRNHYRYLLAEIDSNELELKSVCDQAENLRGHLQGISQKDKAIIEMHEPNLVLEQLVTRWVTEITSVQNTINEALTEIEHYPTVVPEGIVFPLDSEDYIRNIYDTNTILFNDIKRQLSVIQVQILEYNYPNSEFSRKYLEWIRVLNDHMNHYETAKQQSSSQQETLKQIAQLEERTRELRISINEKKQPLSILVEQDNAFRRLSDQYVSLQQKRTEIIQKQCDALSSLSSDNLRAILKRGQGTESINSILRDILLGSNIRKEKIDAICLHVASSSNPIIEWYKILNEFEALAFYNPDNGIENLPQTPLLNVIGLSMNDITKISGKMSLDNFITLYLTRLEDIPVFEYKTREQEYIDFVDASAGQQATALIHILLNQDGPTLIIDQPEEDLDNQMVSKIADLICDSKKKRQLIFTSHNANFVVNGDAELVACCDYSISGDQSSGVIKHIGAIDILEIRDDITTVMEGGEKAFKMRKEKYGF